MFVKLAETGYVKEFKVSTMEADLYEEYVLEGDLKTFLNFYTYFKPSNGILKFDNTNYHYANPLEVKLGLQKDGIHIYFEFHSVFKNEDPLIILKDSLNPLEAEFGLALNEIQENTIYQNNYFTISKEMTKHLEAYHGNIQLSTE